MSSNTILRAFLALTLMAAVVAAGLLPGAAGSAKADAASYVPEQVIVRLAAGAEASIEAINTDYGTTIIRELKVAPGTYLLATPAGEDVAVTVTKLRGDLRLAFAEPNYLSGAPEASPRKVGVWGGYEAAPRFDQYALSRLDVSQAQQYSKGAGITVAVIDTGVQLDHPALAANLLSTGYDFIDGDAVPEDVGDGLDDDADTLVDEALGHGSHVAGIVLLVAPEANILPIRALNADGIGEIYGVAMAIEYAVDQGADIINLSLGTDLKTDLLEDVVREATRAGVLVIAAAGNTGSDLPEYPAADPCAIGVTSHDQDRELVSDAASGPWVDLAAPGESIYSAMLGGGYGWWSGTSMAAPFVSGQAALIKAIRPDMTLRQITTLTRMISHDLDSSGEGNPTARAINIGASVQMAFSGRYFSSRLSNIPAECVFAPVTDADVTSAEPTAEPSASPAAPVSDAGASTTPPTTEPTPPPTTEPTTPPTTEPTTPPTTP